MVGGGISGLATAVQIQELSREASPPVDLDIQVLEAESVPGGKIRTRKESGCAVEIGPNGFLDSEPKTLELAAKLGLTERLCPAASEAKSRYLFLRETLKLLPLSPPAFLRSNVLSLRGRLRSLMEPLVRVRKGGEESIADFARRRLGKEAAKTLVQPFVQGVFGGDYEKLSLPSCFPRLREMELEHGSLIRGLIRAKKAGRSEGRLTSFPGGMEELIKGLSQRLGDRLRCGVSVESITRDGASYRVAGLGLDAPLAADALVVATESFVASRLLTGMDPTLATELAGIEYAPMVVMGLCYPVSSVPFDLSGFGFLAARGQGMGILGCVWESSLFPDRAPRGHVMLRVMIGGGVEPEALDRSDEELIELARKDLQQALSITEKPESILLHRWKHAIPQYTPGHGDRLQRIDERLALQPGLFLTGNSYRGVAVNQCVAEADRMAREVFRSLD